MTPSDVIFELSHYHSKPLSQNGPPNTPKLAISCCDPRIAYENMLLPQTALPDDPIFSRLVQLATRRDGQVIVDDRSRGTHFGYGHILHGTVDLVQKLQSLLNRDILDNRGGFYIAVLAPNSYEFIIAVLAVLALGGVAVPMRESVPPVAAKRLAGTN